jgi:hypothetical protein
MAKIVFIPSDKYENTEYIKNKFSQLGCNLTDKWDDADIVFNPFKKKIPDYLANKEIYSFPNHKLITVKTSLPNTVGLIDPSLSIIPKTYTIHTDQDLDRVIARLANNGEKLFIVKPSNLFGGMKINVLKVASIAKYIREQSYGKNTSWVIQEYLDPPLLIKHKTANYYCKFDLRVNLFMCTNRVTKVPEIYQYDKILVRVSDEEYTSSDTLNLLAHVTNLDLRKVITDNAKRVLEETPELAIHKKTINQFMQRYIYPLIMATYTGANEKNNNYFQRYGVDLMIMKDHSIKLIEINNNPGQALNNDLVDSAINYSLGLPLPSCFELQVNYSMLVYAEPKFSIIKNSIITNRLIQDVFYTCAVSTGVIQNVRHQFLSGDCQYNNSRRFIIITSGCSRLNISQYTHLCSHNKNEDDDTEKKIKNKIIINPQINKIAVSLRRLANDSLCNYWCVFNYDYANDRFHHLNTWPSQIGLSIYKLLKNKL